MAKGQPVKKGSGIVTKLKKMTGGSDVKAYFILWKYAPELLPNKNIETFQELADNYACFKDGTTEENCNAWLILDDKVQRAVKWLVGKLHQQRTIELYEKYYQDAKNGDVKAFNAIVKFSKDYFADDKNNDVNEISAFFQGVHINEDVALNEDDDFNYDEN